MTVRGLPGVIAAHKLFGRIPKARIACESPMVLEVTLISWTDVIISLVCQLLYHLGKSHVKDWECTFLRSDIAAIVLKITLSTLLERKSIFRVGDHYS